MVNPNFPYSGETDPRRSIELSFGEYRAKIDPVGAYVETLSIGGRDILAPRRELSYKLVSERLANGAIQVRRETKYRGGMHACFPYFGAYPEGYLPQHGFARDMAWEVVSAEASSTRLKLPDFEEWTEEQQIAYPFKVEVYLDYELTENGLSASLSVTGDNESPEIGAILAPGFHPYYAQSQLGLIALDCEGKELFGEDIKGKAVDISNYEWDKPKVFPAPQGGLLLMPFDFKEQPKNRSTFVTTDGYLPYYVLWSDDEEQYLCFEPVAAVLSREVDSISTLFPGETAVFRITIGQV